MKIKEKICSRISQRYFLALMCMLGITFITLNHSVFHLLMKEMIYSDRRVENNTACPVRHHHDDEGKAGVEEFLWGTRVQVYLMSAWSCGYLCGRLPAGLLTDKFGAKTLFGYAVFISGICSILTPICARTGPYIMVTNRLIMGYFSAANLPALAGLAVRWFKSSEIAFMMAIMLAGFPLGSMLKLCLAHYLAHVNHTWVTLYYVAGVGTVLWSYFWQAVVWDDPFEHPYISRHELELLVDEVPMYANDSELEPGWSWPWKDILSSPSLWTMMMADMGYSWFLAFATVIIPTMFYPVIHNYDFSQHELLGSFVYLLMGGSIIAAGVISDKLIKGRYFNITHVTKTYFTLSTILGSLLFLGLTHTGCRLTTIHLYFLGGIFCLGIGYTSYIHGCMSISPNFVGTIIGITSILPLLANPLQIYVESAITTNGTLHEWMTVSYLNAAVAIFSTAIFLKWGNCQLKPWNNLQTKPRLPVDYESWEATSSQSQTSYPKPEEHDYTVIVPEPQARRVLSSEEERSQTKELSAKESLAQRKVDKIKSNRSLRRIKKSRSRISIE